MSRICEQHIVQENMPVITGKELELKEADTEPTSDCFQAQNIGAQIDDSDL